MEKRIIVLVFLSWLTCMACTVPVKVSFGDMLPEPQPVGGEVFQIDKLAILTPYILAALLLLTFTSILIKRRRGNADADAFNA